jgi:hypothetical protein
MRITIQDCSLAKTIIGSCAHAAGAAATNTRNNPAPRGERGEELELISESLHKNFAKLPREERHVSAPRCVTPIIQSCPLAGACSS